MVVPAWTVYLFLAVVCAASLAFPLIGSWIAGLTAFLTIVRLSVLGLRPFKDEVEF